MRLKLENSKLLFDIVNILSEIVIEINFKVNKEGMNLTAIDPANVLFISLNLSKNNFLEMEVDNEILGINLDIFKSILGRAKGEPIELIKEENKLIMKILNKSKEFELSLFNVESEEKKMPNLDFTGKIEINSSDLSEYIEDCSIVADSCSFISNGELFIINAHGDLNSFNSELTDEIKIEGIGNSKFSLEYLNKIIKASKLTDKIILNLGKDYPLKMDFINDNLNLSFILAPRVETE